MPRITINILDELHERVKQSAIENDRTFTAELKLILQKHFKNITDEKSFNESEPKEPMEKHQ